ncbi:hypothetical protein JYB64_07170 [Algoriphagus aestuarii]|nr:hypothetical protein [Algoriphagus aestuarii]
MKKKLFIFIASISLLSACQQEEAITPREYPFVESIQVSSINETGATVEFEILKAGKSSVESYGIEYVENYDYTGNNTPKDYVIQEFSGSPSSEKISARISYDLLSNKEYLVKPFVRSGAVTIYGTTMIFDSKGVKGPEIKEVSTDLISSGSVISIKGDYFHSRLDFNQVQIPGLDEFFRITLLEASRVELLIRIDRTGFTFPVMDHKFDLIVTSGGKTVTLENYFTIGYPTLVSVSPLFAEVGDEIEFTFDTKGYSNGVILGITEKSYAGNPEPKSVHYYFSNLSNAVEKKALLDLPPGKYQINILTDASNYIFPTEFEVKNSWEVYRENSKLPIKEQDQILTKVGDKLVLDKLSNGYFQLGQIYDLKSNSVKNFNALPGQDNLRGSPLITSDGNRYLYFGLGNVQVNQVWEPGQDFYRMDLMTGEWETLPKLSKTKNAVVQSFNYLGKIYVIFAENDKFWVFDPISKVWSESSLSIPRDLYLSGVILTSGNTIYFTTALSGGTVVVKRMVLGQPSEILYDSGISYGFQLALDDTKLILTFSNSHIISYDLQTSQTKIIQSIPYFQGKTITSWGTSEGVLFIYPINYLEYVANYSIYRMK